MTNATLYLAGTRKVTEVGISLLSATMTVEEREDNVVIIDHRFCIKGLLLSEKCQEGTRRTLLRRPVKLGTRSAESCTRIFVILCRGAASSF